MRAALFALERTQFFANHLVQPERSPGITPKTALEAVAYQSLLDVSQAILQHRDLNGLFRDLSIRLHAIVHFDFLNLVLHDPDQNVMRLHILASATGVEPDLPALELPPEESPSGWVFSASRAVSDPGRGRGDALAHHNETAAAEQRRQLLLAAADHGAAPAGRADVWFRIGGPLESQLDFMRQISAQVAVAVDNTLNFENAEEISAATGARARPAPDAAGDHQRAGLGAGHSGAVSRIIACLRRVMPHEYSSLVLIVPGNRPTGTTRWCSKEIRDHSRRGTTAPLDETPAGRAVETRRPELFDGRAGAVSTPLVQRLVAAGIQSLCCIPLITGTACWER